MERKAIEMSGNLHSEKEKKEARLKKKREKKRKLKNKYSKLLRMFSVVRKLIQLLSVPSAGKKLRTNYLNL